MSKEFTPLRNYLTRTATGRSLLQKQVEQQKLLPQIRRALPNPVDQHCIAVVKKQDRLILFLDASVWANRLRFLAPQLLRQLRDQGLRISEVKVRVMPASGPQPPSGMPAARRPSAATCSLLLEAAAGIADPALSATLKRLARSSQRKISI